jgi:predicted esterase
MVFNETTIGTHFLESLKDPIDNELQSWIVAQRRHVVVHGVENQVVPMRLLIEARDLIEKAGGKVELILVSGHHPIPGVDVQAQIKKIIEVLHGLP